MSNNINDVIKSFDYIIEGSATSEDYNMVDEYLKEIKNLYSDLEKLSVRIFENKLSTFQISESILSLIGRRNEYVPDYIKEIGEVEDNRNRMLLLYKDYYTINERINNLPHISDQDLIDFDLIREDIKAVLYK